MKKILFAMMVVLLLAGCSKDDEKAAEELTKDKIIGSWSTGSSDLHKYIDFDADNTGYYGYMSGANIISNYTFDYSISKNQIIVKVKYSDDKSMIGKVKTWDCRLSGSTLNIANESENGIYKKLE